MKLNKSDIYWAIPLSLLAGAVLSFLKKDNWLIGWFSFSFLFLISFLILIVLTRWASDKKTLLWIVFLAFLLRFAGGVTVYLTLPILGYDDEDDQAGFVYTDARRRDEQAWQLATSEQP